MRCSSNNVKSTAMQPGFFAKNAMKGVRLMGCDRRSGESPIRKRKDNNARQVQLLFGFGIRSLDSTKVWLE